MFTKGFVWELAERFKALVVFAEHRYYGESLPFGNQSFNLKNIHYLTSEQALADFAYIITDLKSKNEFKLSPVIGDDTFMKQSLYGLIKFLNYFSHWWKLWWNVGCLAPSKISPKSPWRSRVERARMAICRRLWKFLQCDNQLLQAN